MRIGTYGDRLRGFQNLLTDPRMYSPFGLTARERAENAAFSHDQIGQLLLDTGVIGVLGILIIAAISLVQAHRAVLRIEDEKQRRASVICLCVILGTLYSGVL